MAVATLSCIEPAELYALLTTDPNSVSIVDVRDDDRTNWIKGSISYPSLSHSAEGWARLAESVKHTPTVVFHCMFSQVRGPKAGQTFLRVVPPSVTRVCILRGGFVGFKRAVGNQYPDTIDHASDDDYDY